MKPGDKVWVFVDYKQPEIKEATLVSIGKDEDNMTLYFIVFSEESEEFYSYYVFPTREALCEHYRKIFE